MLSGAGGMLRIAVRRRWRRRQEKRRQKRKLRMIKVAARAEAAARMVWETWASIPRDRHLGWGVEGHFEALPHNPIGVFVPGHGPVWQKPFSLNIFYI